jgi:hypothetical protein
MTSLNLRRQPSATLRLRRLSTGNDYAHPRADLDSRRVVRSPLRDAGSAYRDRPTSFVTPLIASHASVQCTSATDRQPRNPHSL